MIQSFLVKPFDGCFYIFDQRSHKLQYQVRRPLGSYKLYLIFSNRDFLNKRKLNYKKKN